MLSIHSDDHFMRQAYLQAEQAYREEEVPIGAVVVSNYRIIGKGYNQVERLQDPTAHAEMLAITAACETMGSKFLDECTLFVTIEPCPMCAGALAWTRVGRIVYGAREKKFGYSRFGPSMLHPKTIVQGGILSEECAELMRAFFAERRD